MLANTNSKPIRLFVTGGGDICSVEGTCQGDPLAMAIYSIAIMPLIRKLNSSCPSTTQCWYADDDGAADYIVALRRYWQVLTEIGPGYGYFPNPIKTVLLTKIEHQEEASRLFADTGVSITTDGCLYLGGAIGERQFCHSFVTALAEKWSDDLRTLAHLAQTQPHAAYTVFTKGLLARWKYHLRCTECFPEVFETLDNLINSSFLPALTGRDFTNDQPERVLVSLPVRHGGLAIPRLASVVADEHKASSVITQLLVDLVVSDQPLSDQDVVLIHAALVASPQASVDVRTDRRCTKQQRL